MHDQPAAARLVRSPGTVEVVAEAGADALDEQPHRFAGDLHEAFHTQHRMGFRRRGQPAEQAGRIGRGRQFDDETFEVVMVVTVLGVVMGWAVRQIVLGRGAQAQQDRGIDASFMCFDDPDRARHRRGDLGADTVAGFRCHQVGLVQDDQVGAQQLVLEHFLQRVVVIDGAVGRALRRQPGRVIGEAPVRDGRAIDHRDDAIDGQPGADVRPVERFDQGFRQRQARGLDDDVFGRRIARQQGLDGGDEVVGDGAAEAAVGELDDVLLRAAAGREQRRHRRRYRRIR